ncbi:universal stress protein [Pseudonocardia benzenivorans]|uniref:universal stress protein n=1 Tax=Pseudonocardia TaxID=1847 RepID=UPI002B3D7D78|nr:universal stress protein [Pseudonocardia sp. D17]
MTHSNGTSTRPCVVVGVDGSAAASDAVRWAAADAALRGLPLRLVAVARWPARRRAPSADRLFDGCAAEQLAAAAALVRSVAPTVPVTRAAGRGPAAAVLSAAGRDAELVVLGSRGRGPVTGALLGSVGRTLAETGPCPVVVVHERGWWEALRADGDPVVVGVGHLAGAAQAVRFAFDEAERRAAALHVVRVVRTARPDDRAALDGLLADETRRRPSVDVVPRVVEGDPVDVLTRLSATAQLVVLGTRVRRRPWSPRGHVHRALLRHARCPTVVVRSRDGRA